jgi:hypothetical protein
VCPLPLCGSAQPAFSSHRERMQADDRMHDWTSPTKAAKRAEFDRFRNLGQKNYIAGCQCEPVQQVASKSKYTTEVDLVDDICIWTCTCPGRTEPRRRTTRAQATAALPASVLLSGAGTGAGAGEKAAVPERVQRSCSTKYGSKTNYIRRAMWYNIIDQFTIVKWGLVTFFNTKHL